MKVCVVSLRALPYFYPESGGPFGGAEAQSVLLARTLAARGHQVSVVLCDYHHRLGSSRYPELQIINAYDTGAGVPILRFFHPRWSGFEKALEQADADVYLQMCASVATGWVGRFCRRKGRAFVFATASDSDVEPRRLRLGRRDRWIYERGLRHADAVITQHPHQARLLEQHYGLASTPVALGVELPERTPEPAEPPRVLWVGTFRGVKRPSLWLDIAERLPQFRFTMIGGRSAGEPQLFEEAEHRARGLNHVDFVGPVPAIETYLDPAWVLLNTSKVEGFPTTFLEAWARGIPTASFFDPDDLVTRHRMGVVAVSAEQLEIGVREIAGSRARRDEFGARARAYVRAEHAPQVVADRVERVFDRALTHRRAG